MKWMLFLPELYYLAAALVFFCLGMRSRPRAGSDYLVALLLASGGVVVSLASLRLEGMLFLDAYRVDLFSQVFKAVLAMGLLLVICLCDGIGDIEERHHPELYVLFFVCTLAMMLLVSSVHLLTIYLSLELSSYSLYLLVPLRRGRGSDVEAGIKYFLIGVIASAVMLFGLATLYGATRATYVTELVRALPAVIDSPMVAVGLLLTLCGFFFKLALFPFHAWAPDVYEGAANPVTAFIATASKVAAVAILVRMVALTGGHSAYLAHVLIGLAILSMTLGNLVAIVQKDMKRLLAYSSISHAGYVLIGILSMNREGYAGAIFYAGAYLIMQYTCFFVIVQVARDGHNLKIAELAGLHRRSPVLALALMMSVFSLAGIPPTAGFTAKLLVFTAAMKQGYLYLLFLGMINVVISLYYYLLVVKAAYLLEPEEPLPPLRLPAGARVLAVGLVAAIVVVGIFPRPLFELARAAAQLLP